MAGLFISHSSKDDAIVRNLQLALGDLRQDVWIDSRQLRGGDPLWSEIQQGIERAASYAVLISPDAFQSKWVAAELKYALQWQQQRGRDQFPVIPLLLDGTRLGAFELYFAEEPLTLPLSSAAGGVQAALDAILVALGKRLPADVAPHAQPRAEPLEELVLELSDLSFHVEDGKRRAAATARLVYEPATLGQPTVESKQRWRCIAPLGPIEAGELRWYLEKYALWPSPHFRERARQVEASLIDWGQRLHQAALPLEPTENVTKAWARIDAHAGRRFSVHVDATGVADAAESEELAARGAATLWLGLPWELLHDGDRFLFQGATSTRVRRRLPNTRDLDVSVVATPIRVLLVSARPEDESCGFINHRASALPLVETMETLGDDIVRIHVLSAPTLPALRQELDRARHAREPYHVLHFDGHGVYDRSIGLGGLCFEHPDDLAKLERRRHQTLYTDTLGPLLQDHRVPLVFLEACQSAQADQATESVASAMLKMGVASVVAMSHSVLVDTTRRFVAAFYAALARGARVGDAMLEGQRQLKDETFRRHIFGAGALHLQDWFVPVLFQEKEDPQLFRTTPSRRTREDFQSALKARLGELPAEPATGFVGRSRELLALQRLLQQERYAVLRGQGGEGKTTLAAEFARWMVRSQQIRRAAFVSVETHSSVAAVLDALGRQLLPKYSVVAFESFEHAILHVERALTEQSTLLVIDNMESLLPAPYLAEQTSALTEDALEELAAILNLCARLNAKHDTRIVFTSREALPAPFDAERNRRELHRLNREDAIELIEHILHGETAGQITDAARESIEQLVDAVHGHARTLALLAPSLRSRGVEATRASLVELMVQMHQRFPNSREQSLFASVELSLQRLSPANRVRVRVLGVFHGSVDLDVLGAMTQWETPDVASLASELIETGLATPNPYNHLTLNPALCPYLRGALETAECQALVARWVEAMRGYANFLDRQQHQKAEVASTLTLLELPNLLVLLEHVQHAGDAASTIDLATTLYGLLQNLGKPRLLLRVAQAREATAAALGETWSHARFETERIRIEQQRAAGQLREALAAAQALLQRSQVAGEQAYPGADYDLAMAHFLFARVLKTAGGSESARPLLHEARRRFETLAQQQANKSAAHMASACLTEQGDCLRNLGRFDEAAAAYEETIRDAELQDRDRDVAVGKAQLGTVRLAQRRYPEALSAYADARQRFTRLDEPGSVATSWHQTGIAHQHAKQPEAAEDAYRKSLAISVRLGDVAGQAETLLQLGNVYSAVLDRVEDAAAFYRQAADQFVQIGNAASECVARSNLGNTLRKLRRLDDARREIGRAIDCEQPFGHTAEPWKTWSILAGIEIDAGHADAATHARGKAAACYLAYRRDGGENHYQDGRIGLQVTQQLLAGNAADTAAELQQVAADPELPGHLRAFVTALHAIAAGSRDRSLAEHPELDYTMAAELLLLIETLQAQGR